MPKIKVLIASSYSLAIVLILMHLVASAALIVSALPISVITTVLILLLLNLVFVLRRHAFRSLPTAIVAITQRKGDWLLETAGGSKESAKLTGSVYCSPMGVILNFEGKRAMIIALDSMPKEQFRRLRVSLQSSVFLRSDKSLSSP